MAYRTIHTTYGLTKMAEAEAFATPINLTEMAVGDGNGSAVEPTEAQTMLVREVYRANINRVFQDPETPTMFTAELVIPSSEGGFTMREIGVYDADGGLFAVGNLPATYKPEDGEGAFADTVVRLQFMVTNADVITVAIDPSIAVASQNWVLNNINRCYIMAGGTTGQVLRKASNGCGDWEWVDPTDANVVVDCVEEEQTLAAAQVNVDLTLTNTAGLAVYIEGVRLPQRAGTDGWLPHGSILTRVVLGQAYPDGTKIIAVQNEPASHIPAVLLKSENLADVPSPAVARTNLDVFSKAETNLRGKLAGEIFYTARSAAPPGSFKANGAAVSRVAYADLFAIIGTTYGAGDGFTTYNLPDLRGEFIRGLDDGRGVDSGRTLGSYQADSLKAHTHTVSEGSTAPTSGGELTSGDDYTNTVAETQTTSSTGGAETRPRNRAMLACIRY